MNVLLVGPLPPPMGGAARVTDLLYKGVRGQHDVSLEIIDSAVRWRRVTEIRGLRRITGGSRQAIKVWRELLARMKRARYDVVHINTSGGPGFFRDLLLLKSLRRKAIPAILNLHTGRLPSFLGTRSLQSRLARMVLPMATCVVVLDEPSRVAIDEYCPGISIEKIPNFIDPDEFEMQSCGDTECETDVAFVGWVIRNKGILELIAACAELDGCKLTLVGPVAGEIQNALDRLVPRGNTKVEIMGELSTPEVYKVLSRSKLVALPSYTEGFPLIVVEAMCMGKAIIATPVGAIPEMLLEDQLKRRLLGENARKRALSSYTVKAVVPRIIDLWRTLSERGPCV